MLCYVRVQRQGALRHCRSGFKIWLRDEKRATAAVKAAATSRHAVLPPYKPPPSVAVGKFGQRKCLHILLEFAGRNTALPKAAWNVGCAWTEERHLTSFQREATGSSVWRIEKARRTLDGPELHAGLWGCCIRLKPMGTKSMRSTHVLLHTHTQAEGGGEKDVRLPKLKSSKSEIIRKHFSL